MNQHILKYSFSIVLLTISMILIGQDTTKVRGISFGTDLSRVAYMIIDEGRYEAELQFDWEFKRNIYLSAEGGWMSKTSSKADYLYQTDGGYIRLGGDYNLLPRKEKWYAEMAYIGFRIGFATQQQELPYYRFQDRYWGSYIDAIPIERVNSGWMELVGGVRAELFRNFLIGWSVRGRVMLTGVSEKDIAPLLVPGFGPGNKRATIGFVYSVHYRIPLFTDK